MKSSIFEYLEYKTYLNDWIKTRSALSRGERTRIATALRCHLAYISRVLNGSAHLSLEQAHTLNNYIGHSSEQSDFFLLLVLYARSGTTDLQSYYMGKIRAEIDRRSILKNRLDYRKSLSALDQTTYFSAWYYAAVHLLLAIPEFQTKETLARYLRISNRQVAQVLQFLVSSGLAVEKRGRFETGPTSIHLGSDSPMISKHHTNWRLQAMQSLERENPNELHYSSAVTISRKHVTEIRKILIGAIEEVRGIVKASPEECLYCYSLDLFEVGAATHVK